MNTFTIHHLPFTLLSPFTFHLEPQGKMINDKAWKNVKGKMISEVTGGSA